MDVVQPRKVSWAHILAGILVAWFAGGILGFFVAVGSTELFSNRQQLQAAAFVFVVVGLVCFGSYRFFRRGAPDFAAGLLIGGCMVTLASTACGAMLSGLSNMHKLSAWGRWRCGCRRPWRRARAADRRR